MLIHKKRILILFVFIVLMASVLFGNPITHGMTALAQENEPHVVVLTAAGPVTPGMAEYLSRGIRIAERSNSQALIFELNTPGGNVMIMQKMVSMIRGSRVPVVVYVAPRGAFAASAGTVITLAGHLAAMAPETAIGAASPVGPQGEDIGKTEETKVKEILKAQVRSLTTRRGAEALALAEATIEKAKAVSADEALEIGLIDVIANDLDDLLLKIDGMNVETINGEQSIETAGATVDFVDISLIEQLLQMLTDPNIVFILLAIGVQAILIELSHPGGWVPGFTGVIMLALATYGLGVLPVNWFGMVFIAAAFVLFVLDIKAPTHGALTAAGIGSLIAGGLVLFNSPATPQFQHVSVPLVVGSSLFIGGMFAIVLTFAIRAQRTPIKTGQEAMIGRVGIVRKTIPSHGTGQAQVGGEMWTAELADGDEPLPVGTRVKVIAVSGIHIKVSKVS